MADSQPTCALPKFPVIDGVRFVRIVGWPGYAVSDDGFVWSRRNSGHRYETIDGWHRLIGKLDRDGYTAVSLCRGAGDCREQGMFRVCKLVLEAFVGPCPPGMEACHDPDRNPANNSVLNLRWDTHKNNCADKIGHGTQQQGESHPKATFTTEQVLAIRAAAASGESQTSIAKRYGAKLITINAIVRRRNWRHV